MASVGATLNVSLFATGSNSALLSGELATLLTGRTVEFEILPFSFYEMKLYYELNGKEFSEDLFMDISLYILANAGKELSIENIIETYKKGNREISRRTVYNYLDRMKKAYLIHGVGRYNIVGKSALSNKEKQYAIDMGFRTINTNTINYEDTIKREFGAYEKITDASPKYVMSLDRIDMSHDGIIHVNIIDFLLRRIDLILT